MGLLTGKQIEKLDSIGMRWESVRDLSWERHFSEAKKYYEENGNLLVTVDDTLYGGVWLARWLSEQVARFNGKPTQRAETRP